MQRNPSGEEPPERANPPETLPEYVERNDDELTRIQQVAASDNDWPPLMINVNTYRRDSGYAGDEPYSRYISCLVEMVGSVGGKILWRLPVLGQAVGEPSPVDEIIAIWYPSHKALLASTTASGSEETFRLRAQCIARAIVHRCSGHASQLALQPGSTREAEN